MIPAYIISFNRLTPLRNLCAELLRRNCTPVIVDNSSTYPPLLDWLRDFPFPVHTVPNTGSKSPWKFGLVKEESYIVTDSDLDISTVPLDMLDMLQRGLKENKDAVKCGLSLRIDDLPDNDYANKARQHESNFWLTKSGDFYSAPVDTTLALYSAKRMIGINKEQFFNAVRTPEPYTARHLPWYNTLENLTEEEKYYLNSITQDGFWLHEFKRMYYDKSK